MLLEELSNIADNLRLMGDVELQNFARMHKEDPYMLALAVTESKGRQKLRAAAQTAPVMPQGTVADAEIAGMDQGIAQLAAPNMEGIAAASGGIMGVSDDYDMAVGYAEGGAVERYQSKGYTGSPKTLFEQALDAEGVTDPRERAFLRAIHMQESGGREKAPTSNRGAVGAMQILPGTFAQVADKDMDIKNPLDNMRAGIRYARQGFQAAGGDPVLAGAYYYGGPGGMQKAKQGQPVADPQNPKAPNTIEYGKNVAQRMTDLMPVSTAYADTPSERPMAPSERDRAIAQIPGQTAAGRTTRPETSDRTVMDRIFGGLETAAAVGTGMAAIPLGAGRKLLQEAAYGRSDPMSAQMSRYTFAPRGEAGREYTEGLAQLAQDLKIPGYLPAATPVGPGLRAATQMGRAGAQADEAAAAAAQAAAPRIPGTLVSETRPGSTEVGRQAAALAQQKVAAESAARASGAAQQEAAASRIAQARLAEEGAYTGAAGARANVAGVGATAAQAAPEAEIPPPSAKPEKPDDGSYDRLEKQRLIKQGLAQLDSDVSKKDLIEAAKKTTPDSDKKGWSREDWLLLGLGLLSSKNSNFLGALGEAGVGVIKNKREMAKEEREEAYRRALTRESTAKAQMYESGTGDVAKATAYADKAFDSWLAGVKANPMLQMSITPEQIEAKRQQYLREAYAMFKIQLPAGVGTPYAAGSKLSPADAALVNKYS